jgi:cysteine desulfurase
MIYADNAATTKLDMDAFEAMKPYLLEDYGNISQPYAFVRGAKKAVREAREIIASCINANPEEVYFTSGGTESDNWAIKGFSMREKYCCEIITSSIEHHAVLNSCKAVSKLGVTVKYLPVSGEGIVSASALDEVIGDSTGLVSVMYGNNEIGTIQPVKDLAAVAHSRGALFHTDAVQAVGHMKIDVKAQEIDMLSASGHKFHAPKGIGFLYIRNGIDMPSHEDGGSQEKGLRAGTENIAGIVAMAKAIHKNCNEMQEVQLRLNELERIIIDGLDRAGIVYRRNGASDRLPGNLSLSFKGMDGESILHRLDLMGICVSTGAACDSVHTQISHVLRAIHMPEDLAKGTIRISLGRENTVEDAKEIVKALVKIARRG